MARVASLFLPTLAIERIRRLERSHAQPDRRAPVMLPVDDDPGACSVPRGGGWRPGARWVRGHDPSRATIATAASKLPAHQRPTMRKLGRRSEAADHPFRPTRISENETVVTAELARIGNNAPLVLATQVGGRQLITTACGDALRLGLAPRMPVAQARVLIPGLDVRPADPEADAAVLERLALHAVRHWTPLAAIDGDDGLWLDLTGTTHLFGGEERFCKRIIGLCRRLGLTARIAIAGTPGAAHAMARHSGHRVVIVPPGGEAQVLAPLPPACLRLAPDAIAAAARFGLERVGDLLGMPRGPLARRLGLATVRRLDEALGRTAEPIIGITPVETPTATRHLLEPIGTAEAIGQVIRDMLAELVERLREGGLGARTIALIFDRIDGGGQQLTVGTVRATRDAAHLARLFELRIDRVDPGMGIEAMHLTASRTEPLGAISFNATLAGDTTAADVTTLIDQLAGRAGSAALFTVGSVETDVPERATARDGPLAMPTGWPAWKRPVRLLHRPEPLGAVVALLPDHPPRRFEWRGNAHVVVAGDGPERIHGDWWRRDGEVWSVRDYFRVEDETGARFWVFRRGDGVDAATGDLSWHMHGLFG